MHATSYRHNCAEKKGTGRENNAYPDRTPLGLNSLVAFIKDNLE